MRFVPNNLRGMGRASPTAATIPTRANAGNIRLRWAFAGSAALTVTVRLESVSRRILLSSDFRMKNTEGDANVETHRTHDSRCEVRCEPL